MQARALSSCDTTPAKAFLQPRADGHFVRHPSTGRGTISTSRLSRAKNLFEIVCSPCCVLKKQPKIGGSVFSVFARALLIGRIMAEHGVAKFGLAWPIRLMC